MKTPLCWKCKGVVIWRPINGVQVALEQCAPGDGDVGIQRQLNGSEIAVPMQGTRWRRHSRSCNSASFVGAATTGKVRL